MPRKKITAAPVEPEKPDGVGQIAANELVAALNAVLPLTLKDDTLPVLGAVKIESDGDELTFAATDRYVLGAYRVPWDGGHVDAALRGDGAKDLLAWARKVGKYVPAITLTFSEHEVEAFDHERKATFPLYTDNPFVNWRNVMPGEDPSDLVFRVNKEYIGRFAKAGEKGEAMRIAVHSPLKPLRITIGERFTGLIMPVRPKDGEEVPARTEAAPAAEPVPEPEAPAEPATATARVTSGIAAVPSPAEPAETRKCGQCKGFGVVRKYGASKGEKYKTLKGAEEATEKGNSMPCPACHTAAQAA